MALAVEQTLDAAHALMSHGIYRYPGKKKLDLRRGKAAGGRRSARGKRYSTICGVPFRPGDQERTQHAERGSPQARPALPQENLLYFLEKTARACKPWQRELLRIVRHHRAVFLSAEPDQGHERGLRDLCALPIMTIGCTNKDRSPTAISSNSCSPHQCGVPTRFRRPAVFGFNPYALGFAMMQDIERVCRPDDEDREWFPEIAGTGLGGTARHLGELSR